MRSDVLKRHQKTHEGLQSLNDEEVLQELRSRQESFIRRGKDTKRYVSWLE